MELVKLKISNYRNLDNYVIEFNTDVNFIVGENNIGKTNLLHCLNNILNGKSFLKDDFADEGKEISIELRFHLTENEIGVFDDLVDPEAMEFINIIVIQKNEDEYLKFLHKESEEPIPVALIKKANIISYDSLRNPKNELVFNKTSGAGSFLNYMIMKYVSDNDIVNLLNKREIKKVETYISERLSKVSAIKRFDLSPKAEVKPVDILSKIMTIKDINNINVPENGYGVQFNLLIILSLLQKIVDYVKHKNITDTEFSTILLFDEPEIHLHPYLQRTIINDIMKIAKGQDEDFNKLLFECFGITKIQAQVIVATHSPNIISDDYTKIIRMYKDSGVITSISGLNLDVTTSEKKHFMMQFEYIKEVVFSRTAIVVEGDSEYGSFKYFGELLNIDYDRDGIAIIKANGADSVMPIVKLLTKFGIPAIGIVDKDKKEEKKLPDDANMFYTTSKCFDSEVVKRIIKNKNYDVLESILCEYDSRGKERKIQKSKLNKIIEQFKYKNVIAEKDLAFSEISTDDSMYEVMYVSWFSINKGIILGKVIGKSSNVEDIPICYRKALNKIKGYAKQND